MVVVVEQLLCRRATLEEQRHIMSRLWFQSVISVVFRDEKSVKDSLQLHEFWHSRQHSAKQRILDIGKLTRVFMMNINNNTNITIKICASSI